MVWLTSDTEPYAFIEAMQASFPNTCIVSKQVLYRLLNNESLV
jgi:hypothetical protein